MISSQSAGFAFLVDRKLLLCSMTSSQSTGFAFLVDRKLLLCSMKPPRIAFAILAKQSAGFAFVYLFFLRNSAGLSFTYFLNFVWK